MRRGGSLSGSRRGGWLWFQQPLQCAELVGIMFRNGFSIKQCEARLSDRFSRWSIKNAWYAAYHNRFMRMPAE